MNFLYILLALVIFGFLIFIHELGHFLVARMCGVKILEFAIGMGPKVISWRSKKSGTAYSLRLFPLGGFVSMLGENGMEAVQGAQPELPAEDATFDLPTEPVSEEEAKHAYCNQSVWKRILISFAGPLMNLLLGFVLMLTMVLISGPSNVGTTVVGNFHVTYAAEQSFGGLQKGDYLLAIKPSSPSEQYKILDSYEQLREAVAANPQAAFDLVVERLNETGTDSEVIQLTNVKLNSDLLKDAFDYSLSEKAGLKIGDEIIKVNNTPVHIAHELSYEIMNQGYKPMTLTVLRNGEKVVLENVIVPSFADSGATFGSMDFRVNPEGSFGIGTVLKNTWYRSISTVKMVFDSLFGIFSGRYGMQAVSGPVGITKTISDMAQTSWLNVLYLVTVISINLGIMNLLPIPALDGGHLLIYFIELIRRKPMKRETEGMINFIGLVIMLALAILIAIKDIITL